MNAVSNVRLPVPGTPVLNTSVGLNNIKGKEPDQDDYLKSVFVILYLRYFSPREVTNY